MDEQQMKLVVEQIQAEKKRLDYNFTRKVNRSAERLSKIQSELNLYKALLADLSCNELIAKVTKRLEDSEALYIVIEDRLNDHITEHIKAYDNLGLKP